jgi:hypothetical protein
MGAHHNRGVLYSALTQCYGTKALLCKHMPAAVAVPPASHIAERLLLLQAHVHAATVTGPYVTSDCLAALQ